ncbi:MAG: uracil-xanthine permease [Oscillospiraceae bacterium]|nr:uracil-xanthine permease [Oscillospiraceae bacterium]
MKLKTVLWGGDKPGRAVTLGIQHVFAMFGSTVLVPALTGLDPAVTLFCMGVGTLIFHLITKGVVPAFMGSSFSFIASITAVAANSGGKDFAPYVGWGIMASGILYLILSLLVKLLGTKRITSFFPPIVTGCMIIIIGMMLAPTAMSNITTVAEGIPVWKNWIVAVVTIAVIIIVMFFFRGFWKLIPILFGIIAGYLTALALGMVDTQPLAQASWFALPKFTPFFQGTDWSKVIFAITMIAPISIVTFVEHVGDITANGAVTGHNYIEDPGLHRTLLGCGLASVFSGGMGGPAATTYSENTGVLAATRNYNPATLRIAAVFAIVLSLFGKVSGLLGSIPSPVMGGVSVVLFGMIASVGLRMLVENHVDFTKSYNLIIAAVMLVIGLGLSSGISIGSVTVSGTAIAAVLGVILAKILPKEESEARSKEKKK